MKSLTLLLIPLLFLASCTIDWNDEKDIKIAELEKQVGQIQAENAQLIDNLSGTLLTLTDREKSKKEMQYELEAITSDTYTKLKDRMSADNSLLFSPDDGEYIYKNDAFEGKNTGFCYITRNSNRSWFDEKEQVLKRCKPGNIILEEDITNKQNCILSPDWTRYIYPSRDTDTTWKNVWEYYKTTNTYILFFNKRQWEYCDELIQTDPKKFKIINPSLISNN